MIIKGIRVHKMLFTNKMPVVSVRLVEKSVTLLHELAKWRGSYVISVNIIFLSCSGKWKKHLLSKL